MTKPRIMDVPAQIVLEYVSMGADQPGRVYRNFPVEPANISELQVAIQPFNPDIEEASYGAKEHGRPQLILSGSPAVLEELGRYLIALARLDTENPMVSGHFDDVRNSSGGTVHLIIRREQGA